MPLPFFILVNEHWAGGMLELGFSTGGNNDQIDSCCCLYLSYRNLGACNDTRAASSVGRHDYASPRSLRRGYAHGQWSMRDHHGPPPGSQVPGVGCRARLPQVGLKTTMPGRGERRLTCFRSSRQLPPNAVATRAQSTVRSKGLNGARHFFRASSVTATLNWARQQLGRHVLTR